MTEDTRGRVSEEPLLVITREDLDNAIVLSFIGEADMSTAALVQRNLEGVLDTAPPMVVLDLSNLTFVDSTTISLWIIARQKAEETAGLVRIAGASGIVAQVIEISGIGSYFIVTKTVDEALLLPADAKPPSA